MTTERVSVIHRVCCHVQPYLLSFGDLTSNICYLDDDMTFRTIKLCPRISGLLMLKEGVFKCVA